MNLRKGIFDYIKNRYEELYKETPNDKEYTNFKDNFEKNAEAYFQKIAEKYLPKPMLFIKYVFLIFKKKHDDGKLIPMVFNVKEIKPEHQPLLKRVERLIKHELPYRFGILSDDEYNNGEGNEKDPFDDEYKLFYSRYRYGKFFHITTEYVHNMSNISDKAHGYKNSITLEELIYACGLNSDLGNPFLEDLKIEYEIREHQINNYGMVQEQIKQNTENKKNRSDIVFDLYEKDKKIKSQKKFSNQLKTPLDEIKTNNVIKFNYINLNTKTINQLQFILMFKSSVQQYTLIYSLNSLFYKLVIESNIKSIIDEIITELNTMILSNNSTTIKFKNPTKLFKIVSIDKLDKIDYKFIIFNNPLVYIDIKNNYLIDEKIDLSVYYKNSMLISQKEFTIKNLYKTYPLIYLNYKNSNYYTDGYKKFKDININTNTIKQLEYTKVQYEDELNKCSKQICLPDNNELNLSINYIFYNSNDCKYDFVEIINNGKNKILLYVFPSIVLTDSEKEKYYIRRFLDLNKYSLPMLKEIKKIYLNKNYLCFLHVSMKLTYNVLHFHLIKKNDYLLNYPEIEKGVFIFQNIHLDTLIDNIENNKFYYNNLEYNLLN